MSAFCLDPLATLATAAIDSASTAVATAAVNAAANGIKSEDDKAVSLTLML